MLYNTTSRTVSELDLKCQRSGRRVLRLPYEAFVLPSALITKTSNLHTHATRRGCGLCPRFSRDFGIAHNNFTRELTPASFYAPTARLKTLFTLLPPITADERGRCHKLACIQATIKDATGPS